MNPTRNIERPNGIYEQAKYQTEQACQTMSHVGEYAEEYVQTHPMSTVLATFAIGMVAGTCLISLLMQPDHPRSWRDDANDWGRSMTNRMKRFVPDLHRT